MIVCQINLILFNSVSRLRVGLMVGSLTLFTAGANALEMPTLPGLVGEVLAQHPSVRSQQSLLQAADAQVEGAKWQYWPTPSLSVDRITSGGDERSYGGDKQVVNLGLRQPLWTGGRLSANLSRAEARATGARQEVEITRHQLALRVIQAWSDLIAAQASLAAYERSRNAHERLLKMVLRRVQEGVSSQGDVVLAQSRLESVLAEAISANTRKELALERLQLLVGRPLSSDQVISSPVPFDFNKPTSELLSAAVELSPQLADARAQVKVAESDIDTAKANLLPELSLRVERQFGNFYEAGPSGDTRVFLSVSTTLGAGLSSSSAIQAARAHHSSSLNQIEVQQLALSEQVRSDLTLSQMSTLRRASLETSRRLAAEVSLSSERQFLAGRKQWLDLMNAARDQTQTEVQLADVLGAEQLAGWRLKLYTQGIDAVVRP